MEGTSSPRLFWEEAELPSLTGANADQVKPPAAQALVLAQLEVV